MQYIIKSVRVRNFKCFNNLRYYEYNIDDHRNPIIFTGPNGFGKTTFFDAVELTFSKKITRFDVSIERQSSDLKKNILLYDGNADGYIVCTMVNKSNDYLSILVKIDHNLHCLNFNESLSYGILNSNISTDELDSCIYDYQEWKTDLSEFNVLEYSKEYFNVFYYVSQAESVHFLKNSITSRKQSLDVLLDIDDLSEKVDFIENTLIGKQINTPNVIINRKIAELDSLINNDIILYKQKQSDVLAINGIPYSPIFIIDNESNRPFWDKEDANGAPAEILQDALNELEQLHHFVMDYEDYLLYLWNQEINNALHNGINDYLLSREFIVDDKIDISKINEAIIHKRNILKLYNNSAFICSEVIEPNKYNKAGLKELQTLFNDVICFDVDAVGVACEELMSLKEKLSSRQTVIKSLEKARVSLFEAKASYNEDDYKCPYCGQAYDNVSALNTAYESTQLFLNSEMDEDLKKYTELEKEIKNTLSESKEKIRSIFDSIGTQKIQTLPNEIDTLELLKIDVKRINDVLFLYPLFEKDKSWESLSLIEKVHELNRIALDSKKTYSNSLFISNFEKYNYGVIYNAHPNIKWHNQVLLKDENNVNNKKHYIENLIIQRNNNELQKIHKRLSENVCQYLKLKKLYADIKSIKDIYIDVIQNYKNQIINKLKVPLLIYTSKLLQTHQNGMGVFINENEMRFVTNGDTKNDILNTFSSGQLAGFVLAFLFSMNKLYANDLPDEEKSLENGNSSETRKKSDDIGFILIDDPVQTMDDINIASLIEVLRNDFNGKQIILSTHELDKENYILYKFLKYNMLGQAFNVKDELYGI